MKRREKMLAGVLVAGGLAFYGLPFLYSISFGRLDERWDLVRKQNKRAETMEEKESELRTTQRHMGDWKRRSLPPDALVAERQYQQWLTDLAQLSGVSALRVVPEPPQPTVAAYKTVRVTVKGEATFPQLTSFLHAFRKADLLHRVAGLKVEASKTPGGPFTITLLAEGLCVDGATPRARLFPRTTLSESLPLSFDSVKVASADGFPKEPGFNVRIGNEIIQVTKVSGNQWSLKRAVNGSTKERHKEKSEVELFPIRPEYREKVEDTKALAVHPFTRPIPPPRADPNDPARQTRLMASISAENDHVAYLENGQAKSRTLVRKGTQISIGDIKGVVVSVEPTFVHIQRGADVWELDIGKDLRSMRRVEGGAADDAMAPE